MKDLDQIMMWLKEGEHDTLDFKLRVNEPAKIAKNICAFANRKGGIILVGVSDYGDIRGVDPEQEMYVLEQAAADYCDPPVRITFRALKAGDVYCLAARVYPSTEGPVEALDAEGRRKMWVRYGDECIADEEQEKDRQIQEAIADPVPIYSTQHQGLINYLKIHHTITIKQYQHLMDLPFHLAKQSLERLRNANVLNRHKGKQYPYYTLKTD